MAVTSLFDRVAGLVEEIGAEKRAAAREKRGMEDPGGHEGPTTHPSKKPDDDERDATEGEQSADNTQVVKKTVPDSTDSKPDATSQNTPKVTEALSGEGADDAAPTGEDPSTEDDYQSKPNAESDNGEQGSTTHPATSDYGEKYSADHIASLSNDELLKTAAALGNEIAADLANGLFGSAKTADDDTAFLQGAETAAAAAGVSAQLDEIASEVLQGTVKAAYHQADLVTAHLANEMAGLQKQAEETEELADAVNRAGEGEDHADTADNAAAAELLAAMGNGASPPPESEDVTNEDEDNKEEEEPEESDNVAPPPELGQMNDDQALQELAMALLEAGIEPEQLAALAQPEATKIASAVYNHKRSGKFAFTEAKQGSAARKVRDYMKGFVLELYQRSQK